MGPLLPGDGRRDQAEGLARTRRAVRDGPDDSRSRLTEVCLGQLAPFIDDSHHTHPTDRIYDLSIFKVERFARLALRIGVTV